MHLLAKALSWAHAPGVAAAAKALEAPQPSEASLFLIIGLVVLAVFAIVLLLVALIIVSTWKIFAKAGKPGWAALIPFYNYVVFLDITNEPLWWVLLMCIPGVNLVLWVIVMHRLAVTFGRGWWFTVGMLLLPFVFFPILAFGRAQYANAFSPAKPMTEATKWALLAAFACLTLEFSFLNFTRGVQAPEPLRVLSAQDSSISYATDGTYVYANDQIISGADPLSFSVEGDYASDYGAVYYDGSIMPAADTMTFKVLEDGSYAQDQWHVYYAGSVISDEPQAFSLLDQDYAKDSVHAYYDGQKVIGADMQTFSLPAGGDNSAYAIDAHSVYFEGNVLTGADPSTFVIESGALGKAEYDARDAHHYYEYGEVVK